MLWIFALAIIMLGEASAATETVNLTAISWEHAVNSQEKLQYALASKLGAMDAIFFRKLFSFVEGRVC